MSTSLCPLCWTLVGYVHGIGSKHRCAHGAVCRRVNGGVPECPECKLVDDARVIVDQVRGAFEYRDAIPVMTPELVRVLRILVTTFDAAQRQREDRKIP